MRYSFKGRGVFVVRPILALVLSAGIISSSIAPHRAVHAAAKLRVALVLHGNLGDKSFFDSAQAGMVHALATLPITERTIQAGNDQTQWQPALADAAAGPYDVIIAGTFLMNGYIAKIAPQYPNKKFILFDDVAAYSTGCCKNVYSIQYKTSDASYMTGYIAGKVSKSKVVGAVLGAPGGPVAEYYVGFQQGAVAADPTIKVLKAVSNTFSNPATGKELALAQIHQGADVIFPIAGSTGLGSLQAVRDTKGTYAIGVDSDQALLFAKTDPAQANVILTSALKDVGQSLYLALKGTIAGTTPYGKSVTLGITSGAVGIAQNQYYLKLVPAAVRAQVEVIKQQLISGKIKVKGVL